MTNTAVTKQQQGAMTLGEYLFSDQVKQRLELALPKWMSVDRLLRVTYGCMMQNPKLKQCTGESWFAFLLRCAQLGLEPVLGRCYPIPRQNRRKQGSPWEVHWQPGYQGLLDLAHRSKEFSGISAEVVYDCDDFKIELGTHRDIHHVPDYEGRAKAGARKIGAYAIWVRKDGFVDFEYMPIQDIYSKFRARSDAYNYAVKDKRTDTPWISDEDDMIKKSMLKHSSKYQPASIEIMEAAQLDDMLEIGNPPPIGAALGSPEGLEDLPEGEGQDEGPDEREEALETFYGSIPQDVDINELDEYIEFCMQGEDYEDVNAFQAAVVIGGHLEQFFEAFKLWRSEKEEPEEPPPPPPKEEKPNQQPATKKKAAPQNEEPPPPPPPPGEEYVEEKEEKEPPEAQKAAEKEDEGNGWPDKNASGDDLIDCPPRGRKLLSRICEGCKTRADCENYQEYLRVTGGKK